ncbi:MAG: MBL fold metallo-hydrolase [Gammaproteobacteria bacterium]|nr:MBL fold metallo-hydrolase [Gammaproteobacteria bacterium]
MMRWLWIAVAAMYSVSIQAGLPAPKVEKITERVYALLGPVGLPDKKNQGYMVNSTVIIGEHGVILIDTGFNDEIGAHIKQVITTLTPKPVTHIINTHHHGDHSLGNSAFPGAQVLSTQKCKELLESDGYMWIDIIQNVLERKFPNTKLVPASDTFAAGSTTDRVIDGVKLRFIVPLGSHTPGDMMIVLLDEKTLIAGDIVVQNMAPSFRDAHVKHWIATLDQIAALDVKTIIPGHGPVMLPKQVPEMRKRMSDLYAAVEAGYKKGLTDSEIRKTLDLSEWRDMVSFEQLMGININRTFLEIEQDNF